MSYEPRTLTPSNMTVGYAKTAAAPPSIPAAAPVNTVGDELGWLDQGLNLLQAHIDTLDKRLFAVLTPPGPDAEAGTAATAYASPLVLKIRDERDLLDTITRRLSRILDRIEL